MVRHLMLSQSRSQPGWRAPSLLTNACLATGWGAPIGAFLEIDPSALHWRDLLRTSLQAHSKNQRTDHFELRVSKRLAISFGVDPETTNVKYVKLVARYGATPRGRAPHDRSRNRRRKAEGVRPVSRRKTTES